jgi:hypothetical protein
MRSTNINKGSEGSFDLVIDGSSLYDLTIDYNLNDINMNSIYNKTLSDHCLMVDANVATKTFNYIRQVEDYDDVASLVPTTDVPPANYFQYQYATSGYTMFEDRMEQGWTAEFITNFATTGQTAPLQDILFYMGKTQNLSGQTSSFTDNNFVVVLSNGRIVVKQIKYRRDCECEDATDVPESLVYKTNLTLPTGSTLHHLVLVFQRDLKLTGEDLIYKGNNISCDTFPNNHWYDGLKYRMGTLKIYLDGLLREVLTIEEPIFRKTPEALPQVQGWALGDESIYPLSVDFGVAGSYTGSLVRGRYYSCPLRGDEIRINFELFAEEYNMTNNLTGC